MLCALSLLIFVYLRNLHIDIQRHSLRPHSYSLPSLSMLRLIVFGHPCSQCSSLVMIAASWISLDVTLRRWYTRTFKASTDSTHLVILEGANR